jgi:cytochrome c biogenesis protein CcdA/thiol-disulfide isomerase/thioredoxin
MQSDLVNIGLGFLEGFALIISPCILPILPIILAGSFTGSKKRPLGVITGFVIFFAIFTFFSRKLVIYSGIDLNIIRHIAYVFLLLLGVIMMSSYLTDKFGELTRKLANTGSSLKAANNTEGGFGSGVLFGGLIAIIWTPCAGPILAAIIVQTVIQQTNLASFLTVLAFGIGAAVPMLFIALFGRNIMAKLGFFKTHTGTFRKLLGAIIIASVGYMFFYLDGGFSGANASPAPLSNTAVESTNTTATTTLQKGLEKPYPAPAIDGIVAWINSPPLTLSELKGKVVLIDFWTYSCINCIRTLPYINDWYQKYHDKGLVIIGVHSPEFDFEKSLTNVKNAVAKDQIAYPVALDSQFVTWRNYQNSYWPAHYLIDKDGNVVYTHFGEGDYDVTENNIRYLLGLKETSTTEAAPKATYNKPETHETYFGYNRATNYAGKEPVTKDKTAEYSYPTDLAPDQWALQGPWTVMPDHIVAAGNNAALKFNFRAGKVFIVMGNATTTPINVKLVLNGNGVNTEKGKDVVDSSINVNGHALYEAIVLNEPASGILELIPSEPGLEIYTFTFGDS